MASLTISPSVTSTEFDDILLDDLRRAGETELIRLLREGGGEPGNLDKLEGLFPGCRCLLRGDESDNLDRLDGLVLISPLTSSSVTSTELKDVLLEDLRRAGENELVRLLREGEYDN